MVMTSSGSPLWPRLAQLPLLVEDCELERLEADPSSGVDRVTTQIRLLGAGTDGLGEDISPDSDDEHDALHVAGPSLRLAGEWTLERFCDHLAGLEQWSAPPTWEAARLYRNWAYESAAGPRAAPSRPRAARGPGARTATGALRQLVGPRRPAVDQYDRGPPG